MDITSSTEDLFELEVFVEDSSVGAGGVPETQNICQLKASNRPDVLRTSNVQFLGSSSPHRMKQNKFFGHLMTRNKPKQQQVEESPKNPVRTE